MNIAIIPARGGSKRIPRKNIRSFCGRPIIEYSIDAARASQCFTRIFVSTDDEEIAEIASAAGAETPFRRPAALADDHAPTLPVISHAIETIASQGVLPERVCCIYPTAPLLRPADISQALDRLLAEACCYVMSVTTFDFPIQRALRLEPEGGLSPMFPDCIGTRSQDLPQAWHDAGQFYWGTTAAFQQQMPMFASHSRPFELPRCRVQDIDTMEDWERAEQLFLLESRGWSR